MLTVVVRAPAGLQMVEATAYREDEPGDSEEVQFANDSILLLRHADEQTAETQLTLEGEVQAENPGTYSCGVILAHDVHSETTKFPLDPPRQFRIVPNPDIPGKPEVRDVGQFE